MIVTKEIILKEDLIKAIQALPNTPNGYSDVYDKNRLMYMASIIPSHYVDLDIEIQEEREDV